MSIRSVVARAVALGLVMGASAAAQAAPAAQGAQLITTGVGEVRAAPDRATIVAAVETRGATSAAAAADNARRQRAVIDTLRALGIAPSRITTVGFNVEPEMGGPSGSKVTGYVVRNSVRVELDRVEDVSRVIDAAIAKGANEMSSLAFYSSRADSLRQVAIAQAVSRARADADALARAAGGTVGPLLELSTDGPARPPMPLMTNMMAAARVATPIQPGEQEISVTVTARWGFIGR